MAARRGGQQSMRVEGDYEGDYEEDCEGEHEVNFVNQSGTRSYRMAARRGVSNQ